MASGIPDRTNETSDESTVDGLSNLEEFRDMVNVVFNTSINVPVNNDNTSLGEQSLDGVILVDDARETTQRFNSLSQSTIPLASVDQLPSGVTDSLNIAAKRLSFFYESVRNPPTPTEEDDQSGTNSFNQSVEEISIPQMHNTITTGSVEPVSQQTSAAATSSSTLPKPIPHSTTHSNPSTRKRHIMISYNRSSRATCEKIYKRLVERNYKVWMDLTDMVDNILEGMARAVENSYIVLLCINQQYYESGYCRLEAEYAAENRVKFIPCLMEKEFRPQSWLGIIKGANMHVDFSDENEFENSMVELIRQISDVERQLSLQPRCTPAPSSMVNPMRAAAYSTSPSASSSIASDINSRRFDAIIREYKQSIKKTRQPLTRLKRSELSDIIVKLRQELFTESSQVFSDSEKSDDEDEKLKNNDQILQQLLHRSMDQNEILLRLVDRMTTAQPEPQNTPHHLDMDGILKVIIAVMLLWALNIICQKE